MAFTTSSGEKRLFLSHCPFRVVSKCSSDSSNEKDLGCSQYLLTVSSTLVKIPMPADKITGSNKKQEESKC